MNIRLLYVVAAVTLMSSCQKSTEYITKATDLTINVVRSSTTASYVKANVKLADDRAYYFCGIVPDTLYKAKSNNDRFMQLVLDYQYKEYINWRYDLLEKDSPYIASFADHCLYYGNEERFFAGLSPQTTYMVYAFCVNPETMTPMGSMDYEYVKTLAVQHSDLTFDVRFEMKDNGPYVTVIPSNDTEPYIWDYVETEFAISKYGSVRAYANYLINYYKEMDIEDQLRTTGFSNWNCSDDLEEGHKYTLMVCGYDSGITTEFFTWDFSYPFTVTAED